MHCVYFASGQILLIIFAILLKIVTSAEEVPRQRVPSKPVVTEILLVNSTAIKISWNKPAKDNGAKILGYYIYWMKTDETDTKRHRADIVGENVGSTVISGFEPNTEYKIHMTSFNKHGDGEYSQFYKQFTGGLAPSEPVISSLDLIGKKPLTPPFEAQITWSAPLHTYNAPILKYYVWYKSDIETEFHQKEYDGNQFSSIIPDLAMGRQYQINVAAVNDYGVGPNATELIGTPEGTPEVEPTNLRYELLDGQVTVSWDPPAIEKRNGQIIRYEAVLTPINGEELSTSVAPINNNITKGRSKAYSVNAQQSYQFKVAAATSQGLGPFSQVLNINPDPSASVQTPSNVAVQALSNTTAVVQWNFGEQEVSAFVVKYIQQPTKEFLEERWIPTTVANLSARHLKVENLSPNTAYAFCVLAVHQSRQGRCSEPPVTVDKLESIYIVSKLNLTYKTAKSISLAWSCDGPPPDEFYVTYSGIKDYFDQDLIKKSMKVADVGNNSPIKGHARTHLLTGLRPDTQYTVHVGARVGAKNYWPDELRVTTDPAASPVIPAPMFIESRGPTTALLKLRSASEEYGLISYYYLIVYPGNSTDNSMMNLGISLQKRSLVSSTVSLSSGTYGGEKRSQRRHKHARRFAKDVDSKGGYVTANITAFEMREKQRNNLDFELGDGKIYGGFENRRLDINERYRVALRAFTAEVPSMHRPPQTIPEKLWADSDKSVPFSTRNLFPVREGKASNLWLIAPLIALLVVVLIIAMLVLWLRWQRCNKKSSSHNSNRHSSITKVAIGNSIPSETSKLLSSEAYGRQVMNPYEQANGTNGHVMESSMDMYPLHQSINYNSVPNPLLMLPSSGGALGGHTLSHPPIPISELAGHIEKLKMNNNALFSQEYESIETGQHFKWENSVLPSNKTKNRYANVVAYDHSRVELSILNGDPSADYINANYVDGYEKTKAYIATQGPLPETFADFWRMVWEQNSATIVMLTKLEERSRVKCDQYWPTRGTSSYGNISVTLIDTLELAHYTIRTMGLQYRGMNEAREIRHLQYTAWPDHGVPDKPTPFLMFLKRVKTLNPPNAGPIISHCSAGIGRTGAFIAIDCMLERLRYENTVDIFGCVTALRSQRSYMVQTDDQYIFIHDAVLDAAQSGSTEVPVNKLRTHVQALLHVQPLEQTSGIELEFGHLAALKMMNSRCAIANLPANKAKNRLVNMVPYDSTRVCLEEILGVDGSDYINASWIDGYRQRNAYIATQGPLPHTANDFWRMIWEHESAIIVMLVKIRELGRDLCCEYWPAGSGAQFGHLVVEPIAEYNMPQYVLREFRITNTTNGQSRTVRHFQYVDWPEQGIPKCTEQFIDFIHQVHHTKTQFGKVGPITVHCATGAGRTGVFIALSIIIDRMKLEQVVDVFTTVKLLRSERQNMVQDKEQYHFCYQAALEFYDSCDNPYQT